MNKSHIAVRVNGRFLALSEDTSIDLVDTNPFFNDSVESYSYQFEVPIEGNREIFGDIGTIESDKRLVSLEHQDMDILVDNVLIRSGAVGTADDQELKDKVSLSMTSRVRALSDYFSYIHSCQELPMPEEDKKALQIGEMIGNLKVNIGCRVVFDAFAENGKKSWWAGYEYLEQKRDRGNNKGDIEMELNPLGFSFPAICSENSNHISNGVPSAADSDNDGKNPTVVTSFINVTDAYGEGSHGGQGAKFCNARVCYMHYLRDDDGKSSDQVDLSFDDSKGHDKKYNPYLVLEANRPASGICFYLMYFLDVLFHYLKDYGISYDNSELLKVEDMKRLAFFTTQCHYDLERKKGDIEGVTWRWVDKKDDLGNIVRVKETIYDYNNVDDINHWLSSRNCGGKIDITWDDTKELNEMEVDGKTYRVGEEIPNGATVQYARFLISDVTYDVHANIMNMYANAKNFPDTSPQSIIDSLWASFGIRFYLNQETRVVKPVFIRDIFRDPDAPIVFPCKVITAVKESEKITGFRMKYSAESDRYDQEKNIREGVRDYDTSYDYIDYNRIDTTKEYKEILNAATISNMALYVDRNTGNKYRIKVDKEASTADEYHPLPFEVGQFKGVEIGDCSPINDDFIEEAISDFQPLDWNDVNGRNERLANPTAGASDPVFSDIETGEKHTLGEVNVSDKEQVLAAFIDDDMWHENTLVQVRTAFGTRYANFYVQQSVKTRESYDPSNTDEGTSPLQEKDWGVAVALMRGGGSESTVQYYDRNYDKFGNAKFRQTVGVYGMSSDSIDCYGNVYDYNGTAPGIGGTANGSYDGTYARDEARYMLGYIFSQSNANLLNEARKDYYVYAVRPVKQYNDTYYFIFAMKGDDGSIIHTWDLSEYISELESLQPSAKTSIWNLDRTRRRRIVSFYRTQVEADFYAKVLTAFQEIYFGDSDTGVVSVPVPPGVNVTYGTREGDRFSLKIRAYIEHPDTGEILCDKAVAHRGLYDTFMSEYAHFILNRKKVKLEIECEISALTTIHWDKRYRFGDYVGWINRIDSHVSAEKGLEKVTVELYVL